MLSAVKKRSRHVPGGRVTPKGTPHRADGRDRRWARLIRAGEPDLLAEVRSRLATIEPLDLLAEASVFLAALDPHLRSPLDRTASRDEGSASLDELVRTFAEVDRIETSALLARIAQLAPDNPVGVRVRMSEPPFTKSPTPSKFPRGPSSAIRQQGRRRPFLCRTGDGRVRRDARRAARRRRASYRCPQRLSSLTRANSGR